MAAPAVESFCSRLETDVTCTFIRSSRLSCVRSTGAELCAAVGMPTPRLSARKIPAWARKTAKRFASMRGGSEADMRIYRRKLCFALTFSRAPAATLTAGLRARSTNGPFQRFEKLRKRNGRGLRAVNGRFPIRAQRRNRERHGDAVIAKRIQFGGVEALAPRNRQAVRQFLRLNPHAAQVLGNRGDAVGLLDAQLAGVPNGKTILAGRA